MALVVGLTGGIGSGKSTVSALLAERGAIVIDADAIAREVVLPGGLAYAALVERFPSVILDDGTIDRPALAAIVFNDPAALRELNTIIHPAVATVMAERMASAGEHDVVVLDIPLLAEARRDRSAWAGVIVVDTPEDVAVTRLVANRGFSEADARARIANQATREERRAIADVVIDNANTPADLAAEVERAWAWIESLRGEV